MQFKDILKNVGAEGKEKRVPVIEISKGKGGGKADIKIKQGVADGCDRTARYVTKYTIPRSSATC